MDPASVAKKVEGFLSKKVKEAGANGAVVGLSGGLDSSVVATLCARALGPGRVLGLTIPSSITDPGDVEDAKSLAEGLGISTKTIPLESILEAFMGQLEDDKIAKANLMARARMCLLYYHANLNKYLVVGTGNKSEFMLGYSTKFGDGGCDLLPLGDLLKSEVRGLAKYLKIPEKIINKVPSAGLWHGQTDEGEMGVTYEEIDRVLAGRAKNDKVQRMIESSEHKRRLPEKCLVR
jgi:NAD+ synthase